jgi:hypothetical protein
LAKELHKYISLSLEIDMKRVLTLRILEKPFTTATTACHAKKSVGDIVQPSLSLSTKGVTEYTKNDKGVMEWKPIPLEKETIIHISHSLTARIFTNDKG